MYTIQSGINNQLYEYKQVSDLLSKLGFSIGSSYEFDHGYFDYEMYKDDEQYVFIRIPVTSEIGNLDELDAQVRLKDPFVLSHRFESGVDQEGMSGNITGSFNQFASPEEKDAELDPKFIEEAEKVVQKVEQLLI
ncbi:hypothetical protein CEY16_09440 [Halalkalibacillus sediminis]|uniref:YugN-like family protein n=1 Tax=Halalkalibacillus sediminis TaxID=2018042 RepID=A0A2I0QUV2_9BACI|nr:YugN family protein [Halalkalibacillus sediminis]PKR78127.1 hypothetical protein CEY16_09440 [Halalkalibacillus sediminis]